MSAPSTHATHAALEPASFKRLLVLAWPIIISRSSQVVVGFSDAVMVADLGEAALAATTTGALNCFNLLILPMGIVFIVSTFSSQLMGKGDLVGARRYGLYGLGIALAAQAACLASLPFVPAALEQLGYAPDVRTLMATYLRWRLLTGGAAIGMEALANYYGGLGNTRLPMLANVAAMALNVDFAPTFLDAAGVAVPGDMQGRSLVPVLRGGGRAPADWRTSMYYRYYHDPGDHHTSAHRGVRTRTHKLIHFWKKDQWELFDLVNDPYELHNLYGEPGQDALTATLKTELARLKKELRDDDQLADVQIPNGVDGPVARLRGK